MDTGLHIELASERVGNLFGLPLTNTLLTAWAVMLTLFVVAYVVGRRPQLIPGKLQNLFEMGFEYVLALMEQMLGSRAMALKFFPLITTIFLFIFTSNLFDFLPIFGTINLREHGELVPLFHPVNTDLNVTLALAIISFFTIEVTGILTLGVLKYGSKFVNFKEGFVGFLVGLVELVGNLARLISLSFRLFGNIFAGEVLLLVIGSFAPYVAPLPFLAFELFVGFLQAAIFALLTLAFIRIAITDHAAHSEAHAH